MLGGVWWKFFVLFLGGGGGGNESRRDFAVWGSRHSTLSRVSVMLIATIVYFIASYFVEVRFWFFGFRFLWFLWCLCFFVVDCQW